MKIESIKIKNFKAFKDAYMTNIPDFCVIVGANGTGKSTIFSLFSFLKEAFTSNVNVALSKIGGPRGFQEVRSRNCKGPIEIEIQFREKAGRPLITYSIEIDESSGKAFVKREILKYRRGRKGTPWHFLDFAKGKGIAVTNEVENIKDYSKLERRTETLKSPDILAIKGLGQFDSFPAVRTLANLIENWHISDFHINKARPDQIYDYAEHLSKEGENLSIVIQYLFNYHREIFQRILTALSNRIPGISKVESKTTEEGRVLLRFKDESFEDPFLSKYVSDGTLKMLAYLVLLYDPKPHPLLCVEEPEKQLYPNLLHELAEEFREYAHRGGQVFVSTHSPDFLNAIELEEVFWLEKENGYTKIVRAKNNTQISEYMKAGDQMGYLWKQGFFGSVDPEW